MNNQREIYEALLAGETLIHDAGHKTRMTFNDGVADGNLTLDNDGGFPSFYHPKTWQIYKEPKWSDDIPEGGVLCFCWDNEEGLKQVDRIEGHGDGWFVGGESWKNATPLPKQEIQVFMDNAPEEL